MGGSARSLGGTGGEIGFNVKKWSFSQVLSSQKQKIEIFSHRYLIEFYETNRMSHVPHLYDVVNLLK